MTKQDLRKRASWLNGVAGHVASQDVADLLRQYARDLNVEAEFVESPPRHGICGKARLI